MGIHKTSLVNISIRVGEMRDPLRFSISPLGLSGGWDWWSWVTDG